MPSLKRLTPAQVDAYRRDGFYAPVDAFDPADATALRRKLEAFEATLPPGPVDRRDRRKLHVRLPWMRDLVSDPRILDAVEDLIGPDILVFNSTFFIKEPHTGTVTAWHQDGTYFGLDPHEHVTAWVAFTDSSEAAGCMRFLAGSHHRGQLRHTNRRGADNLNNLGQSIAEDLGDDPGVAGPLRPGQMSLHHTLVVHQSLPNATDDRRIGCGISYIPTHVRHKGSFRMPASLVRGTDRWGHFDHEPDPRRLTPAEAEAAHHEAYRLYRDGYEEQVTRAAAAEAA